MSSIIRRFDENIDENTVKSICDAMYLFRKSNKKKEYYYVVDLKKTIKLNLVLNRIIFNEFKIDDDD